MSVTDYPTYDDVDLLPMDDAPAWCADCGRPMGDDEDETGWTEVGTGDGIGQVCPHCAALAEVEGLEQAERQGD